MIGANNSPEDTTMTTTALHTAAADRLDALNLPADLITDESGQTNETEHLTWLTTATDADILAWAADMGIEPNVA